MTVTAQEKTELQVFIKDLKDMYDRDTTAIYQASLAMVESEKTKSKLEAENIILRSFVSEYLCTIEGIFDTDSSQLSYEHMIEYISAAKHFKDKHERWHHRINEMEDEIRKRRI